MTAIFASLKMVEDTASHDALLIVTAAGAERVPQLALGIDRLVAAGEILRMPFFGMDFRSRDRNARVEVTDDIFYAVGCELVGNRNALLIQTSSPSEIVIFSPLMPPASLTS